MVKLKVKLGDRGDKFVMSEKRFEANKVDPFPLKTCVHVHTFGLSELLNVNNVNFHNTYTLVPFGTRVLNTTFPTRNVQFGRLS